MGMNDIWGRRLSPYITLPMRLKRARTTGQVISFILIGPTLICLGPSPSELAHPSLPLAIGMIQEREDTCGHLKGAQEPPSLH